MLELEYFEILQASDTVGIISRDCMGVVLGFSRIIFGIYRGCIEIMYGLYSGYAGSYKTWRRNPENLDSKHAAPPGWLCPGHRCKLP